MQQTANILINLLDDQFNNAKKIINLKSSVVNVYVNDKEDLQTKHYDNLPVNINEIKTDLSDQNEYRDIVELIVDQYASFFNKLNVTCNFYYVSDLIDDNDSIGSTEDVIKKTTGNEIHPIKQNYEKVTVQGEKVTENNKKTNLIELNRIFPSDLILNSLFSRQYINLNDFNTVEDIYNQYLLNFSITHTKMYVPKFSDITTLLLLEQVDFYRYFEHDKKDNLTTIELDLIDSLTKKIKYWEKKYMPHGIKYYIPFNPIENLVFTDEQKLLLAELVEILNNKETITERKLIEVNNNSSMLDKLTLVETIISPIIVSNGSNFPETLIMLNSVKRDLLIERYNLIIIES